MSKIREMAKKVMDGIPLTTEEESYKERIWAMIQSAPSNPEFEKKLNNLLRNNTNVKR